MAADLIIRPARNTLIITAGFAGPPGGGGGAAYDDTAIRARLHDLETTVSGLPASTGWLNITDKPDVYPAAPHRHVWADLDDVPTSFAPSAHQHPIAAIDGLQAALDAKAVPADIPTPEALQDLVADMVQAGAGISVTYDDDGNLLRVALVGQSFTTADRDKLAGIAAGATANATDAQLRDRSTHTGSQPISSITDLQAALDGKMPTTSFKTVNSQAITGTGNISIPAGADAVYPIFNTKAEADAWSAANPGKVAFARAV